MKNENIKEILNEIKILNGNVELGYEKSQLLLDYITNLQEEKDSIDDYARHLHNENKILQEELENEILNKEIAQGHRKQVQDIELQERKELKDYKSKNEKAINFIIEWCSISESTGKCICNLDKNKCTELLNILQGNDKDE